MERREFLFRASGAVAVTLVGCGGSSESASTSPNVPAPGAPSPPPGAPAPSPTPVPPPTPSAPGLSTLTLHSTQAGTLPYLATVYPLEGAVPNGQTIVSADDPSLSASILSRWPDGSAQVAVLAGEANVAASGVRSIGLSSGSRTSAPLTAARVGQLVSQIACNFGASGSATLTSFGSPERVWWANERVICCRYRLPIGTGALEAVIDVHAFASNRALVEVVIENGKIDANASAPVRPATVTYINATVSVNGSTVATVSSPSVPMLPPRSRRVTEGYNNPSINGYLGGHEAFRAWYCSTWVGGDPQIEVTHDTASMRAHPWFWKPLEEPTTNFDTRYGKSFDTYEPWATCRLRAPAMDGTGDDEEIAMFTQTQIDYVVSGNKVARRAVLATGLAFHSLSINWRHGGTGEFSGQVPARSQLVGKTTSEGGAGTWPISATEPRYGGGNTHDGSHIPSTTLVPFLCRPSPCFIELAWKEFAWNHTNYGSNDGSHPYDQQRSRAWRSRNYAISIFLTPDIDANRKTGMRDALDAKRAQIDLFFNKPWNTLGVTYGLTNNSGNDWNNERVIGGVTWTTNAEYMEWFQCMAFASISRVKALRGAQGTAWDAMTVKRLELPVRRVNEATGGEWRTVSDIGWLGPYVAGSPPQINMGRGNFGEQMRATLTGTLPDTAGPFLFRAGSHSAWSQVGPDSGSGYSYSLQYFMSLCAAVEFGIPGAEVAWNKVLGNITNFSTWRLQTQTQHRFSRWPRNK